MTTITNEVIQQNILRIAAHCSVVVIIAVKQEILIRSAHTPFFSGELPISASRGYWRVLFLFINESLWHHRPKEEIALIEASHFDRYAYLLFIRIFLT